MYASSDFEWKNNNVVPKSREEQDMKIEVKKVMKPEETKRTVKTKYEWKNGNYVLKKSDAGVSKEESEPKIEEEDQFTL
ncbi:unknown [Clostridium sp. CAG:470]|nr:MAG: hypothetical protein BHW03_02995 [Clostridium sp. 28_17]CDE14371.1 unknown [Clostridium sp. CAG:470]